MREPGDMNRLEGTVQERFDLCRGPRRQDNDQNQQQATACEHYGMKFVCQNSLKFVFHIYRLASNYTSVQQV